VGSIGATSGVLTIDGEGSNTGGFYFNGSNNILPRKNKAFNSGTIDLGSTSQRWKDLHLSGTAYVGTSLGIGTSSPAALLDLKHNSASTHLRLTENTSGNWSAFGVDTSDNLRMYVNNSERMRLDAGGHLLVGTTAQEPSVSNDDSGFSVRPVGTVSVSRTSGPSLDLNRKASNGYLAVFRRDGTTVGSIGTKNNALHIGSTTGSDSYLGFYSNQIIPTTNDGSDKDAVTDLGYSGSRFKDLYLSGGVYLGGTGSANKLDDYEEGTWTPTLPSGGTVSSTVGSVYTKIGNVVYYQMFMQMSGIPNNSTAFYVGGLPFQPSTSGGRQLHGHSTITYINNVDGSDYGAGLNDTNSRVYWHSKVNGNQLTNSNFTGVTQLILAGFYYTA
jgi:hypothetical protein